MAILRRLRLVALPAGASLIAACTLWAGSTAVATEDVEEPVDYEVDVVTDGLDTPWSLTFLPGQDVDQALVTERPGRLLLVDLASGEARTVSGTPAVAAVGQGGLLDVVLHPRFADGERWVYLTYSAENEGGSGYATHLGRGRLSDDGAALRDFEVLYVAEPFGSNNGHFGSRLVFDDDDRLYMTTGDRRDLDSPQDLRSNWGKTLRFNADGSVPDDNPFVDDDDALDAIYTYGHRNSQGMAIHPETGAIWQNEHGQQDGDEINRIDQPGGNYGWPIATYGVQYGSGTRIGDLPHERDDTVNPVYYWDGTRYDHGQSGFPPSGLAIYAGAAFPEWEGDLLMGNLRHRYLARFEMDGGEVVNEYRLLADRGWRIRDVRVHPDSGDVYVLVDQADAPLVRLRPAG
ncbi:PQQ-dependent sugar dehydrogenase [Aquisalimonas sp.]|uniref:PQQ-dependent sugar dehydrogenase n=1 Tax=unclassified Aquisalimonas TaxID=2644645 RepID=UPI0025C49274|nr:PQQ-dependent sugar dehydrogenase [Aquisalimonas sp.]